MNVQAVVAVVAATAYLVVHAVILFTGLDGGYGQARDPIHVLLLNVGVGALVGRWWAVLLPAPTLAMSFLPGAPALYEGPYVHLAVFFAVVLGALVAVGVAGRKLAARLVR